MNLMLFLFVAEKTRGGEGGGTLGIYHNMITVLLDLVSSRTCQVLDKESSLTDVSVIVHCLLQYQH